MKENKETEDWVKRNTTVEPQLTELVEMYKTLDFDVQIRDYIPEENIDECSECIQVCPEKYKVIYTRSK